MEKRIARGEAHEFLVPKRSHLRNNEPRAIPPEEVVAGNNARPFRNESASLLTAQRFVRNERLRKRRRRVRAPHP